MRISDWSSDVCSSDLLPRPPGWRDVARHFFTFAAVSLDRFLWLTGASRTLHVASFRPPEVLAAQDRGGCLMLVAHVGSFEVRRTAANPRRNIDRKSTRLNSSH